MLKSTTTAVRDLETRGGRQGALAAAIEVLSNVVLFMVRPWGPAIPAGGSPGWPTQPLAGDSPQPRLAGGAPRCPARPLAGEAPCKARAPSLAFGRCGVVLAAQITGCRNIIPSTMPPHRADHRMPQHHPISTTATPCRPQAAAAPSHQHCSTTIPQAPLPHRAEHRLQQHHPINTNATPCRAQVAATLSSNATPGRTFGIPRRPPEGSCSKC